MKSFIAERKLLAGFLALLIVGGGYMAYSWFATDDETVSYVLSQVEKGSVIVTTSGTGQVSASTQLEIKPKAGGEVTAVLVKNGDFVKSGTVIAQIDSREARNFLRDAQINLESSRISLQKTQETVDQNRKDREKAVRDARTNLESSTLSLQKLKKPADALALLQAENAVIQAKNTKEKTDNDLKKAYEDGFNDVAEAFTDMPNVIAGIEEIFFDATLERSQSNIDWYANQVSSADSKIATYKHNVQKALEAARKKYEENAVQYAATSRFSEKEKIEALIASTYATAQIMAETIKTSNEYIDFVKNDITQRKGTLPALITTHRSTLDAYSATINGHVSALLASTDAVKDLKTAYDDATRSIVEKQEALTKLKAGADELDIRSAELTVKQRQYALDDARSKSETNDEIDLSSARLTLRQRENALADAQEKLADYSVRAPFDGTVAQISLKKGDNASSGAATATLITTQKIAEISLNEIDVSKVKTQQKATLTFDAIDGLSITGEVAEIDSIGTATQGVVTYNVKIIFDTQDDRVKPGMSVSANIIVEAKNDALFVPNSALKQQGDTNYVEVVDAGQNPVQEGGAGGITLEVAPQRVSVEIGISNDEVTEIISGLAQGDEVVVRTVNAGGASAPATQSALPFGGLGGRRR